MRMVMPQSLPQRNSQPRDALACFRYYSKNLRADVQIGESQSPLPLSAMMEILFCSKTNLKVSCTLKMFVGLNILRKETMVGQRVPKGVNLLN